PAAPDHQPAGYARGRWGDDGRGDGMRRRDLLGTVGAAAIGLPIPSYAQQAGKIPKIGVLWHADSAEGEGANYRGLVEGFRALGYVDGRTVSLLHRFPTRIPRNSEAWPRNSWPPG